MVCDLHCNASQNDLNRNYIIFSIFQLFQARVLTLVVMHLKTNLASHSDFSCDAAEHSDMSFSNIIEHFGFI